MPFIWFQIIAAAGQHGMTTPQVEEEFAKNNSGQLPATATAGALRQFLAVLKGAKA